MPNNLKNTEATRFTSGSMAAEMGRRGGIEKARRQREKGAFKKYLEEVLAYKPVLTPKMKKGIERVGGDPEDEGLTSEMVSVMALMQKAMNGDTKAIEMMISITGEDPKTAMEEKKLQIEKEAVQAIRNSDGFMDAMNGIAEEVFTDGGDTPDAIEDD